MSTKQQTPFPIVRPGNQLPVPTPKPEKQSPKKTQNINPKFPGPTLSSLRKNNPVRRNFPRTWIWEEINMRFCNMNYLLEYFYNIKT